MSPNWFKQKAVQEIQTRSKKPFILADQVDIPRMECVRLHYGACVFAAQDALY